MLNKVLVAVLRNMDVEVDYIQDIRFFHKDNSYNIIGVNRFGFDVYIKTTEFEHIIIETTGDSCSVRVMTKHDYDEIVCIDFDDIDYMMLFVDGYSRIEKIQNDILNEYFSGDKAQYREFFEDTVLYHGEDMDKDDMIEALYNEYKTSFVSGALSVISKYVFSSLL